MSRALLERALAAEAVERAQTIVIARLESEVSQHRARITELEDRLSARSLAELRAFHPLAMPVDDTDDQVEYRVQSDPTGLVTSRVPVE